MTILITGGAGFIGSHLCKRLLDEGQKVIVIDSLTNSSVESIENLIIKGLIFYKADVNDYDILTSIFQKHQISCVYHLASNTSVRNGQQDVDIDITDTFETTLSILKAASSHNVKQFIFTSSSTVYGIQDVPFTEITPRIPISIYGASKLASEAYVRAFCLKYVIQTWIFRFCNVIGKEINHGLIYDINSQLKSGSNVLKLLGTGSQSKPFLYIDDAIDGMMYAKNHISDLFNIMLIGNEDTITVRRIAEIAVEMQNNNIEISINNTEKSWQGDVDHYSYDISKIKALGWKPKYNSEKSILKSIKITL